MVNREITFLEAIREALREEMKRDETVFIIGEDVGVFGGCFGVTGTLVKEFGKERVIDTPISEAAIVGAAAGAAATGMRPVPEVMFSDFTGRCFDEINNQIAKMRYMFGGKAKLPLTIRTAIGAGLSAAGQHSQCLYSLYVHLPGLKVVAPSTPYDAKGLLKSSIRDNNPVMYFEHKVLYGLKGPVPEEEYTIPLGKADIKKEGKDVTIVATALMVQKALIATEMLKKDGISAEVVDPRTLAPLDEKTILGSVKKTGRVVIVDEDYPRCGLATDIAATIADEGFDYLDAPIKRVVPPNTSIPFSPVLEKFWMPDEGKIVKTVKEIVT